MNGRLLVQMQELDGIFDGDYVFRLMRVDEINDGGQRALFSRTRRSRHQHDSVLQLRDLS